MHCKIGRIGFQLQNRETELRDEPAALQPDLFRKADRDGGD